MSSRPFKILKRCLVGLFLGSCALSIAMSHPVAGKVDFRRDVQPLLKQYCIECHGPSQQMHGFRLDRRRDAMRGGTVIVITPGNSAGSRLYQKLNGSEYGPQMPPTGPLSQEQINTIGAWIDQGAEWPDDLAGETAPPPPDPKAAPIMEALRSGDTRTFEKLAREDPKAGSLKGAGGTTPLMQAVLYGDAQSVRLLLDNGANPNIKNEVGATALMWAVGEPEKARLLLEHGADVNARSDDGRTPLLIATGQRDSLEIVKLLLGRGASLSTKSPSTVGYATPLSEAAGIGDDALLRMLIEGGADVKGAGRQALASAHRAKCTKCLEILLEHADRQTASIAAVLFATPGGDASAVKALLDRGADANARDPHGNTLLALAANSDAIPVETVKSLIERGADLNAKDADGRTALDCAKLRGSTAVVDLLIKAGAKEGGSPAAFVRGPKPAGSVRAALDRSIPLLQKTDSVFTQKAGCVSCHHNTLTSITVAAAREHGFSVNEQISRTQTNKIGHYLETWRERVLQGVGIPGESNTISSMLLGLAAQDYPPDAATDAMARFVQSRQWPDGRWRNFSYRPPLESNEISVTATSLRALQVYRPKALRAKYEMSVKRATDWLMKAQPQTTDERVFQLLGLVWAHVSPNDDVIRKAVRELLAEQRSDGGWAQLPSLASDAYATGQALVALKEAGAISVTDVSYKRGIEYLLKTQFEDGSWYVRSRATPLQPFFESGFPYGHDQWISAAATNWAAQALALTGPSVTAGK
ncbi:MAG TPA: ankyrin repeat domain-containing protein [Blastocatellia bacterium]|nr:ankyrin repeat domain-containing protein [Blastocatellia bacterium]